MIPSTIILECGCVVLVDEHGPVGLVDPCPAYPPDDDSEENENFVDPDRQKRAERERARRARKKEAVK